MYKIFGHQTVLFTLILITIVKADSTEFLDGFIQFGKEFLHKILFQWKPPHLITNEKGLLSFQVDSEGDIHHPSCEFCRRGVAPVTVVGPWSVVLASRGLLHTVFRDLDRGIASMERNQPVSRQRTIVEWLSPSADLQCIRFNVLNAESVSRNELSYLNAVNGRRRTVVGEWLRDRDDIYTWQLPSPIGPLRFCVAYHGYLQNTIISPKTTLNLPNNLPLYGSDGYDKMEQQISKIDFPTIVLEEKESKPQNNKSPKNRGETRRTNITIELQQAKDQNEATHNKKNENKGYGKLKAVSNEKNDTVWLNTLIRKTKLADCEENILTENELDMRQTDRIIQKKGIDITLNENNTDNKQSEEKKTLPACDYYKNIISTNNTITKKKDKIMKKRKRLISLNQSLANYLPLVPIMTDTNREQDQNTLLIQQQQQQDLLLPYHEVQHWSERNSRGYYPQIGKQLISMLDNPQSQIFTVEGLLAQPEEPSSRILPESVLYNRYETGADTGSPGQQLISQQSPDAQQYILSQLEQLDQLRQQGSAFQFDQPDEFLVLNQVDSSPMPCDNFLVLARFVTNKEADDGANIRDGNYGSSTQIAQIRDFLEHERVESVFNRLERVKCL